MVPKRQHGTLEMDFEHYTHLQFSSPSLTPCIACMDKSYSRCHIPHTSPQDRLESPKTTATVNPSFLTLLLQGVFPSKKKQYGCPESSTPIAPWSLLLLIIPENIKLPNFVFKLLHWKKSGMCNAASDILIIVTEGYKWNQFSQCNWYRNQGTKGFTCHSDAVCKPVSRLLSCIDCQASWISHWFTQDLLSSSRHMDLHMSSWGRWLKSHSSVPKVVMMFCELFAHRSVCDSAVNISCSPPLW